MPITWIKPTKFTILVLISVVVTGVLMLGEPFVGSILYSTGKTSILYILIDYSYIIAFGFLYQIVFFNSKGLIIKKVCLRSKLIAVVIGVCVLSGCENSLQRAEDREKHGIELFKKGDYAKAGLVFKSALKEDGTLATTYYYLALLNEKNRNFRAMRENLIQAIRFDPENIDAQIKLGRVYLIFNDLDAALTEADEILKRSKDNLDASALKAAVFIKQKKQQEALAIIDDILQKQPQYIEAISLKALILMQNEQFDNALMLVSPVIDLGVDDLSLHLLKIQLDTKLNNIEAVVAAYERLSKLYPEKREFKSALAKIYLQANRRQDAETLLRSVVNSSPEEIQPKLVLLDFLNSISKDKAVEQVQKYSVEGQDNPKMLFQISQWLFAMKYFSEAEVLLSKIGRLESSSEIQQQTIILKAKILIAQAQYDEAGMLVKNVLWVDPNSDEAFVLLAQVELLKGHPEKADKKFREALEVNPANMNALIPVINRSLRNKNVDYASELLKEAIKLQPNNLTLLKKAAEIKMLSRDWDGAKEIVATLEKHPEGKLLAKFLTGRVYQELGDYSHAVSVYKEVLRIAPDYPDVLRRMATCYEKLQQRSEMIDYLTSFIENNPENISAYLTMGQIFLLNNNLEKAVSTYNQALEINKKIPQIYVALAGVYLEQEEYTKAIEVYKQGLEENPNNVRLSIFLASVYEKVKAYQNAAALYESLLAVDPELEVALNNYVALLVDGFGDKQSLEKAQQLVVRFKNSEDPFYLDSFAWVELKSGNVNDAVPLLEKVNVMAEMAVFKYHLGVAYYEQGNNAGAVAQLQQAVDLGKQKGDFAEIKLAQQLLNEISTADKK